MANIEKISVSGTSYDVRDASAAHALTDIATAGDNITFTSTYTYNVQQQGSPTLVDGTATGFSSTKYLYETNLPDDDVTYYFKIKMPSSLTWADIIRYGADNEPLLFLFAIWVEGGVNSLRVWNETAGQSEVIISQISANTTYWLKVQISGDEKTYSYSTDGTNYTQSLVVNDPQTVSKYLQIGGGTASGFYNGTVYLTECYAVSGDTEVWRGATLDKSSINATVDQTYSSSSTNAQSGVAVASAIAAIPTPTPPALTDIAIAGSNVEFERDIQDNYSVQGSLTINNGVASGFSTSNYVYKNEIWNTIVNAGSFTFQSKFKVTERSNSNLLVYNYDSSSNMFFIRCCGVFGQVEVNINNTTYSSASDLVVTGADYWLRFTYDSTTPSILVELSTDGSTFNTVISQSSVGTIGLIGSPVRIGTYPNNSGFSGSIDLVETSFVDSNGNPLWKLVGLQSDKLIVNATADQTYSSSSTNAQSGVAINGAGFLRNLSTGTNAVDVNYAGTANNSVTMGANTTSASSAITFGSAAKGNPYGVSIGRSAGTAGAAGNNSIAIGNNSSSAQYTGGCTAGTNSTALGSMTFARGNNSVAVGGATVINQSAKAAGEGCISIGFMALSGADSYANSIDSTYSPTVGDIAIGGGTTASGGHAIQIGQGTNSTAQTLNIGFGTDSNNNPLNYQLLDSTGTIPSARMPSDVLKNETTATSSYSFAGATVDTVNPRTYSLAIGVNAQNTSNYSTAIGLNARASGNGTALGINARHWGSSFYSTSLGSGATIGLSPSTGASYATALGAMAVATANGAIQIGKGTNSTASSLSVGLVDSSGNGSNYALLTSDGKIPDGRLPIATSVDSTSTNAQVVGAKLFYDTCGNIETLINAL